tara:strand:- start:45 stop:752 length:708 start_codon:yes stop_codon:yes gene_type:complete
MFFIVVFSCSTLEFDDSIDAVFKSGKKSLKDKKYNRAKGEFEFIILNSTEDYQYVADSYFYLAEAKYYLEKYSESIEDYNTFLKSPVRDVNLSNKAEFMICKSWFYLSNDVMKDQTDTKIAIDKLQSYIEKESMKQYVVQINDMIVALRNKLAEKDFQTAMLYLQLEKKESAIIYFQNIINEYYDSQFIDDCIVNIAYLKAEDNQNLALDYLNSNKDSFLSISKYQDAVNFINNK